MKDILFNVFVCFQYFHVAFLILFSHLLLSDFHPLYDYQLETCPLIPTPSAASKEKVSKREDTSSINESNSPESRLYDRPAMTEFLLAIWVFTLFCEEIRQVLILDRDIIYTRYLCS